MSLRSRPMALLTRKRVSISGVVQGVGFRPFVWRRASGLGLVGWVENDSLGVTAEVQGPADRVAAFLDDFAAAAPPLAVVTRVTVADVPVASRPSLPLPVHELHELWPPVLDDHRPPV